LINIINSHIHLEALSGKSNLDNLNYQNFIFISSKKIDWNNLAKLTHFSLGIHPWYVDIHKYKDLEDLSFEIKKSKPIAVGECGLDLFGNRKKNISKQEFFFDFQINLADENHLPLIVHSVRANQLVLNHLKNSNTRGVIHGFYGSIEEAKQFISLGFLIGIGHMVLKHNFQKLKGVVKSCPIDTILLETDDKNPQEINKVAYMVSKIKKLTVEDTVLICNKNAKKLFGI